MTTLAFDAPPPWPPATPAPTSLARCVLLALLLHVWLVLLLGNAPGGTARRGEGVWGAINVTLGGPAAGPAPVATPPAPPVPSGPPGAAPQPRHGGVVHEEPSLAPTPGAVRLGDWAATPAPPTPEPAPERTLASPLLRSLPRPTAAPALATTGPPAEGLRSLGSVAPSSEVPVLRPVPAAAPVAVPAPVMPPVALPAEVPPAPRPEPLATLRRDDLPTPPAPVPPLSRLPPAAATSALPPLQALPSGPSTTAAAVPPARTSPDALDAGPQLGHDVATPPSAPASAPLRLNLELARPRGGELSRHSSPGVLQLLPRPPELPSKLAREVEKAAKDDCRTAYSGAGLLAVVPLVVDAVRKDGCKW